MLKRGKAFVARVQPRVDVIFDDRDLMTRSQLQQLAARYQRHGGAGGILKIRRQNNELNAIGSERRFERFEIDAKRLAGFSMRIYGNAEAASARTIENCACAGIRRIFKNHAISGAHERFADQIKRLLTAVRNQKVFVFRHDPVLAQEFEEGLLERRVAIGRAEIEHVGGFPAQHGIHANLQFFDREIINRRARHDKGKSIFWSAGGQPAENFVTTFICEEQLPAEAVSVRQGWWRRWSQLQPIAIALDERAATDVALD